MTFVKSIVKAKEDSTLIKKEFNYECPDNPEIGTITYYSDSTGIKLIEHSFSVGDHYGEDSQYFLWDGKLFFHFPRYGNWVFDSETVDKDGSNNSTIDNMTEERSYFLMRNR